MNEVSERRQHLFIVRLWLENAASSEWRGSVEHVSSRQRLYFTSLGDLNEFIARRLRADRSDGKSRPND